MEGNRISNHRRCKEGRRRGISGPLLAHLAATRLMVPSPRSPAMAHTTRTASIARSLPVIPKPRSSCHPRSNAVPSETAETAPTPRDWHLQAIAEHGRMSWQKVSGYNWRTSSPASSRCWKRVIGHVLRSQTDKRQATEVALAVDVLNRMLVLGRPSDVRIV